MGTQMELAAIFTEPVLRRCWLLNKALESASLDEALKLARAADEFLGMGQVNTQAFANEQASPVGLPTAQNQNFQSEVTLQIATSRDDRAGPDADGTSTTDDIAFTDNILSSAANDVKEDASGESCAEEAGTEPEDSEPHVAMTSGLAVLAGMNDIVRYLRQQDDVVVSVGPAAYLVNGRFQLNAEELFARANKIRERQGKPLFQRLPYSFPAHNGDDTAGRRQDRP